MDLSLLKELYEKGLYVFVDTFSDWKEAVACACQPLIQKGYIDSGYVDGIYKNVEKNGFYIFIAPHICIPHCGAYESVQKNCLSFMKCNSPVLGDPDEPDMAAELFFVIAAENEGKHLEEIQRLAEMLENEKIIATLLSLQNGQDFVKLLYGNECLLSETCE